MFKPGNKFGRGRPKHVLSKPELLLPAVFNKNNLNWQRDLMHLYRRMRERELTIAEKAQLKVIMELMPYLVTKVTLKELDKGTGGGTASGSAAMAEETAKLLKQLENDSK